MFQEVRVEGQTVRIEWHAVGPHPAFVNTRAAQVAVIRPSDEIIRSIARHGRLALPGSVEAKANARIIEARTAVRDPCSKHMRRAIGVALISPGGEKVHAIARQCRCGLVSERGANRESNRVQHVGSAEPRTINVHAGRTLLPVIFPDDQREIAVDRQDGRGLIRARPDHESIR